MPAPTECQTPVKYRELNGVYHVVDKIMVWRTGMAHEEAHRRKNCQYNCKFIAYKCIFKFFQSGIT